MSNPVRGAVYQYNADGSGGWLYARGLRNAEGLDIQPGTKTLWVAVKNRDDIAYPYQDSTGNYGKVMQSYVDNHPAELFTSVRDGGNYGWSFCNPNPDSPSGLDRMPFDRDYDLNKDGHVDCSTMDTITKGIQAHSAPLGMKFFRNGAAVALHGSWNRTLKTGYKVIFFPFDPLGAQTDLVSGWLDNKTQQAWGRPVGLAVDPNGSLLVSDDAAGAIYRLTYSAAGVSTASGYATVAPESLAAAYVSGLGQRHYGGSGPSLAYLTGWILFTRERFGGSGAYSSVVVLVAVADQLSSPNGHGSWECDRLHGEQIWFGRNWNNSSIQRRSRNLYGE